MQYIHFAMCSAMRMRIVTRDSRTPNKILKCVSSLAGRWCVVSIYDGVHICSGRDKVRAGHETSQTVKKSLEVAYSKDESYTTCVRLSTQRSDQLASC